ncbi:NAD(P)-binding protein [Auricularia subglabra TFB-10046 SS5]|nr:NAD(P)-binding protein [Auricularia subglabra TFB-10046 SS5]
MSQHLAFCGIDDHTGHSAMPTWLITGTSRGIGLELTKQLAANKANVVIATARTASAELKGISAAHSNLHIVVLDVLSVDSIQSAFTAAQAIVGAGGIDYLINNAANGYADDVADVTAENLELTFKTHVVGPLLVFRTFVPLVQAGSRKVVANVSSGLGSINFSTAAGFGAPMASYSIAKAAQNMLTYKMTKQYPDLVIFAFQPGHVRTAIGGEGAPLTPQAAVAKHIPVFESATLKAHGGRFIDLEGHEVAF